MARGSTCESIIIVHLSTPTPALIYIIQRTASARGEGLNVRRRCVGLICEYYALLRYAESQVARGSTGDSDMRTDDELVSFLLPAPSTSSTCSSADASTAFCDSGVLARCAPSAAAPLSRHARSRRFWSQSLAAGRSQARTSCGVSSSKKKTKSLTRSCSTTSQTHRACA